MATEGPLPLCYCLLFGSGQANKDEQRKSDKGKLQKVAKKKQKVTNFFYLPSRFRVPCILNVQRTRVILSNGLDVTKGTPCRIIAQIVTTLMDKGTSLT